MNHDTDFLAGAAGRRIFWQVWTPKEAANAVLVLVHGASEHSDRYRYVAQRLVTEGYAVYALDHRGHGRSDGARAVIDRIANAVADVDQLVVIAGSRHPGTPIFMLGHSMGATIAVAYSLAHQDRLSGLILSGPLAALQAAPAPLRVAGRVLSAVAPGVPLVAIDSSMVSRDPEVVSAYRSDPLVHHGKLPARTVAELAAAVGAFPQRVSEILLPTLILYGTEDRLCPPAGSEMLAERIGSADKTLQPYQGLYHEILNEPERDRVLDDICAWLPERVEAAIDPADAPTA